MILKIIFWYIIVFVSITVCNGKKPNFITNGVSTTIDNYPFVVSIQWRGDHICTGTLISLNHVLATAHCLLLESQHILTNFKIIAGTADRLNGFGDEQVKDIAIIVYHQEYNPDRFWKNDLAILTLDSPIRVNNFTRLILIRRSLGDMHSPIRSAGWGDPLIYESGQFFDNFQEIYLIPAEPTDCRGFEDKITGALGCARILGSAYATLGDSGCPLVFHNQLIGIISKTIFRQPNHIIYTDIYDYLDWILNNIY